MPTCLRFLAALIFFVGLAPANAKVARVGFFLPDSISDYTLRYKSLDNLIILPVSVNGGKVLHLLLDTGCRNIVLFGKSFLDEFDVLSGRTVEFSGMGSGKSVKGFLSLNNSVKLGAIDGETVPIVIVPDRNIFRKHYKIDGLIGYDIFTRFEIELVPSEQTITFRSAFKQYDHSGFTKMKIDVIDSRPMIRSRIDLSGGLEHWDLLIDTGSALGLLLKSTRSLTDSSEILGKGLNGVIEGTYITTQRLMLEDFELSNLTAGVIQSPWHNYASIGMGVLKDYVLILNYAQSYACLKKL